MRSLGIAIMCVLPLTFVGCEHNATIFSGRDVGMYQMSDEEMRQYYAENHKSTYPNDPLRGGGVESYMTHDIAMADKIIGLKTLHRRTPAINSLTLLLKIVSGEKDETLVVAYDDMASEKLDAINKKIGTEDIRRDFKVPLSFEDVSGYLEVLASSGAISINARKNGLVEKIVIKNRNIGCMYYDNNPLLSATERDFVYYDDRDCIEENFKGSVQNQVAPGTHYYVMWKIPLFRYRQGVLGSTSPIPERYVNNLGFCKEPPNYSYRAEIDFFVYGEEPGARILKRTAVFSTQTSNFDNLVMLAECTRIEMMFEAK